MRLYYFTTSDFGLQAIRDRRLKVARIDELNDPFEFIGLALDRAGRRAFNGFKKAMNARYGMICLSSDWTHPLLWGHYADKHKGLALGFDVLDGDIFEPVKYYSKRLTPTEFGLTSLHHMTEAHMKEMLGMKFAAWSYESEHRAFCRLEDRDPVSELYFLPFTDLLTLKQVIVGARSPVTRARLSDVLGTHGTGVEAFKARPGFKEFAVVENKRKSAWK
ncbi:DUF2971 domain-containing protein [Devosia nitrariae]|uniref:DUF2971 domain-containing protein n=1 Tax=Devosia nitrariae TaxID=2071872 RepID=A0ABQ5W254_9HYPH|nr:DUF2971 domain-containing protein [Devosia nitrariae]GLQ53928.1 hypothetical protein GCM10010862_11870 [Devosia nitrariae]